MPSRLGIDVGESGMDFLLLDESTGETHSLKIPTSHDGIPDAISRGIRDLTERAGIRPGEIQMVVGGLGNVARHDVRVGLLVTQGFEHVLHLGRGRSAGVFAGTSQGREHAGGPNWSAGIPERVSSDGNTILQLDEAAARRGINRLLQAGAQALAICLVNAHANPSHELRLREIAGEMDAATPVFVSHEIAPEAGEYGRALATVLTARARHGVQHGLDTVQTGLRAAEVSPQIDVAQSLGGRTGAMAALDAPIGAMAAGRAGAAAAAARIANAAGFPDALILDVGGAAADVALVRGGMVRVSTDAAVGNETVPVAALDVRRVGGGSRSAAQAPFEGAIHIGPPDANTSAPTVADANIVLGRVPTGLLGVDAAPAEEAVTVFARSVGLDRHRTAEGIVQIFEETLAGALRLAAIEKGEDPSRMALVVCGGAGPMHGSAVGALAGTEPVIVPRDSGALSALGFVTSARSAQFTQGVGQRLDTLSTQDFGDMLEHLRSRASAWMEGEGAAGKIAFRADLRVHRGHFSTSVSLDPDAVMEKGGLPDLAERLADAHRRRFGLSPLGPAELVALRAIATADAEHPAPPPSRGHGTDPKAALLDQTQAWFDGAFMTTSVFQRDRLGAGNRIVGPALIVEPETTTVIGPGRTGEIDDQLNILIRFGGGTAQ